MRYPIITLTFKFDCQDTFHTSSDHTVEGAMEDDVVDFAFELLRILSRSAFRVGFEGFNLPIQNLEAIKASEERCLLLERLGLGLEVLGPCFEVLEAMQ